jgi:hypothetical protein
LRLELDRDKGCIEIKVLDARSQIVDMNCGDSVGALAYNRKRGKLWMETQPGTSVELVEDVVGFSVTIRETRTNDEDS